MPSREEHKAALRAAVDRANLGAESGDLPIPPESRATAQPLPALACEPSILARFGREVRAQGLVGEEQNAKILYLVVTSRLLDRQVSAGVKGHSASGKSHTVDTVLGYFPADDVIEFTAMSERALVYSEQDFAHRTLVIYEVVALREGVEDDLTSYFVRSLLSEGRIKYQVTERKDGRFTTREIVKEGPTNLIFTTTRTRVHAENETRVLSLNTNDTAAQTKRVFFELAKDSDGFVDHEPWHELQAWLKDGAHQVVIPFAERLAEAVPPVAIRQRRDFGALLALIRAHALLHRATRDRDERGRIVATVDDYAEVRELVAESFAAGVEATVPAAVRETVGAVRDLAGDDGVQARLVAERLGVDKSNASRRLRVAADGGYVRNLEDRRGHPARWVPGDPLPDDVEVLPDPGVLSDLGGCAVAPESEGEEGTDWIAFASARADEVRARRQQASAVVVEEVTR